MIKTTVRKGKEILFLCPTCEKYFIDVLKDSDNYQTKCGSCGETLAIMSVDEFANHMYCMNCKYSKIKHGGGHKQLECRRYPPQNLNEYQGPTTNGGTGLFITTSFPLVTKLNYCWEFKADVESKLL